MGFKSMWRNIFWEYKYFASTRITQTGLLDILHILSFFENCISDFHLLNVLLLIVERNSLYLKNRNVPCSKEHKAEIWIKKYLKRLFLKKTEKDCQADKLLFPSVWNKVLRSKKYNTHTWGKKLNTYIIKKT